MQDFALLQILITFSQICPDFAQISPKFGPKKFLGDTAVSSASQAPTVLNRVVFETSKKK